MNKFEVIRFHPTQTSREEIQYLLSVVDDSYSLEHAYRDDENHCVMIYRSTEQRQLESLARGVADLSNIFGTMEKLHEEE